MKICILGGFLGSGKTTVLTQLARHIVRSFGKEEKEKCHVAILENEIGRISIDDQLLKANNMEVRTLFSGCVCCTLAVPLIEALREIRLTLDPEWVIVEATGVAYPKKIRDNIEAYLQDRIGICILADVKRWTKLRAAMETMLLSQLEGADVLLLNKIDLVPSENVDAIEKELNELCPEAGKFRICAKETVDPEIWGKVLEALG